MKRAEQYITSQSFACVPLAIPTHSSSSAAASDLVKKKRQLFPDLSRELEKYTNTKKEAVGEREILTINRCVKSYLTGSHNELLLKFGRIIRAAFTPAGSYIFLHIRHFGSHHFVGYIRL
ncbi:hypothetical protein M2371_003332 [Buttiauxella sp. BIGb0471]|uniref:hypothetical protein n=1 Tax=Buttiauxella sp. BIGb0471 TaxID=2940597 RepID=UPI002167CBCF|nr:hypothetical protein [Buttiauxella sp. BIGb0471]MCS3604096.1 hypothetical protein [Buttiauxella sp. BIGb0471]